MEGIGLGFSALGLQSAVLEKARQRMKSEWTSHRCSEQPRSFLIDRCGKAVECHPNL